MIHPEKLSRSLGQRKLKIGINFNELFLISWMPMILAFFDIEPFLCLVSFLILLALLSLKNSILEPNYLQNKLSKKDHFEWERINIDD